MLQTDRPVTKTTNRSRAPRPYFTSDKDKLRQDIANRKQMTDIEEVNELLFRIGEAIDSIEMSLKTDDGTHPPEWRERAEHALVRYRSSFRQVDRHRNDLIRMGRTPEEIEGIRHKAFVKALVESQLLSASQWRALWLRADELMR